MNPATKFFIVEVPAMSRSIFSEYTEEKAFFVALGEAYRRANTHPGGEVFAFRGDRIEPMEEIHGMRFSLGGERTKVIAIPR